MLYIQIFLIIKGAKIYNTKKEYPNCEVICNNCKFNKENN